MDLKIIWKSGVKNTYKVQAGVRSLISVKNTYKVQARVCSLISVKNTYKVQARVHSLILVYELYSLLKTVTVKCRTAIKVQSLYFKLCLKCKVG